MVILWLAAAACRREPGPSVAAVAGGLPPFDELRGVRLHMTAAELRRARPNARVAGYTGYVEESARGRITYALPGSRNEGEEVPSGSRLEAVSAATRQPSDSAARALWRATVAAAAARLGPPTHCTRLASASVEGTVAMWRRGGAALTVSVVDAPRLPLNSPDSAVVSARVIQYSPELDRVDPPDSTTQRLRVRRARVACPGA